MRGIKVNMVPDFCEVWIDRRIVPGETIRIAKNQISEILKKLGIKAKIKVTVSRPAIKLPKDSIFVKTIKKITRGKIVGTSGYTEAELYYSRCGINCVVCGPGNEDLCHVTNEYIEISQLRKAVSAYEKLIKMWCL